MTDNMADVDDTVKSGHFEKGKWVEDKIIDESAAEQAEAKNTDSGTIGADIDALIEDTGKSVKGAVDSIINLGNTVLGSEKGRVELEKKVKDAGSSFFKSIESAIGEAKKNLENFEKKM